MRNLWPAWMRVVSGAPAIPRLPKRHEQNMSAHATRTPITNERTMVQRDERVPCGMPGVRAGHSPNRYSLTLTRLHTCAHILPPKRNGQPRQRTHARTHARTLHCQCGRLGRLDDERANPKSATCLYDLFFRFVPLAGSLWMSHLWNLHHLCALTSSPMSPSGGIPQKGCGIWRLLQRCGRASLMFSHTHNTRSRAPQKCPRPV